jgi:hypothetical protein
MNGFIERLDLQQPGIWFPFVVSAILLFFILLMPKRQLNWRGIYLTFGVIGYVALILDINIVGIYLDWFDLGNPKIEGLGDFTTYGIIPSCLAVAFLNYFDRKGKWLYVAFFTLISFLFEWELTQVGYMKLKGWQSWYSIPVYILVYGWWLPWHLELMQKLHNRTGDQNMRNERFGVSSLPIAQPAMKPLEEERKNQDQE